MNPKGKKFLSVFLVFSIMMLSVNLYAKERRGAILEIWEKDGRLIKGELIAVREKSLLVLDTEGKDVSFDIPDIFSIRVLKKKSKPGKGALKGLLIGGGIGALSGGIAGHPDEIVSNGLKTAILSGGIGALIGAIIGASSGRIKKIIIEGMTDSELQGTLDYLRKNARIRDNK